MTKSGKGEPFDVPVVFIVYKRLDVTKQSFAAIRELAPAKLYIIADGPRGAEDAPKVAAVRDYIDSHIDWSCEVQRDYAETNMGLRYRMPSGMDWVFSQEEEAIFVEDDINPTQNFFYFCRDMLAHYRDDERVVMVSGTNLYPDDPSFGDEDIIFSYFAHIWGWATWRRAYQLYDVNIRRWPEVKKEGRFKRWMSKNTYDFFSIVFDDLQYHWYRTWGYQWSFLLWDKEKLGIIPRYNLINNMGMGDVQGEHPLDSKERIAHVTGVARRDMRLPIRYPAEVLRCEAYDRMYQQNYYTQRTGIFKKLKYFIRAFWYERVYRIIKEMEADTAYFERYVPEEYKLSGAERKLNPTDTYRLVNPRQMRKSAREYQAYKRKK